MTSIMQRTAENTPTNEAALRGMPTETEEREMRYCASTTMPEMLKIMFQNHGERIHEIHATKCAKNVYHMKFIIEVENERK